jgi:hypothetical protein
MSRSGSLAAVLVGGLTYIVTVLVVSAMVLLRRTREARAAQPQGDFLNGFAIPAWWWTLLLLPPLALLGWWLLQRRRRTT